MCRIDVMGNQVPDYIVGDHVPDQRVGQPSASRINHVHKGNRASKQQQQMCKEKNRPRTKVTKTKDLKTK